MSQNLFQMGCCSPWQFYLFGTLSINNYIGFIITIQRKIGVIVLPPVETSFYII